MNPIRDPAAMPDFNLQLQSQPSAEASTERLAALHKMSTTAGLLSRDYVAVNNTAVVAALLGVASALTLLASILLVIPIVGIVFSIVAWRQIRNSGGTETGKGLAAGGFLLSAVFAGAVLTMHGLAAARARDDAQRISQVVDGLGAAVVGDHLTNAYEMFDNSFKEHQPRRAFDDLWHNVNRGDVSGGRLKRIYWNGVTPAYETLPSTTNVYLDAVVEFERNKDQRVRMVFRKSGERWFIHDIPALFPPPKPGAGGKQ